MTSQIIRVCITSLFSRFLQSFSPDCANKETAVQAEDHIEALIALLENTGKLIEEKERGNPTELEGAAGSLVQACKLLLENPKPASKIALTKFSLNDVFLSLELISKQKQLSSRLNSLIQNLNYRRTNNWKSPEFMTQQPKTLKEIQAEMERYFFNVISINRFVSSEVVFTSKTRGDAADSKPSNEKIQSTMRPPQTQKMTLEQAIEAFSKAYKKLDSSDNEDDVLDSFKEIYSRTENEILIKGYLKTFSDGAKISVRKRVELFPKLRCAKLINSASFAVAFGECLFDLWMEASDFPGIEANYAKIFAEMIDAKMLTLSEFYIHPDLPTHEDKALILETYNQFFSEYKTLICNPLSSQVANSFPSKYIY